MVSFDDDKYIDDNGYKKKFEIKNIKLYYFIAREYRYLKDSKNKIKYSLLAIPGLLHEDISDISSYNNIAWYLFEENIDLIAAEKIIKIAISKDNENIT